MPTEVTPSDGQEVNNTPPASNQTPAENTDTTQPESPPPAPDTIDGSKEVNTVPSQPELSEEDKAKKEARINQLVALGFIEEDGIYSNSDTFGAKIPEDRILEVPDDEWDKAIKMFEEEKPEDAQPEDEPEEEVNHPPFDYTGKVKLSQTEFDAVDAKKAIKAVKNSDVSTHYKEVLLQQIKDDKLEYAYAEMLRMILSADRQGQRYSGHL